MEIRTFGENRKSLHFGRQKINLHEQGNEYEPKAAQAIPGSADLCFILNGKMPEAMSHLAKCNIPIESGPVKKSGSLGPITSVYIRDPDGNLIELSTYE